MVLALEAVVALHTLSSGEPGAWLLCLLPIWFAVVNGKATWARGSAFGAVVGEAVGYFLAVPWQLTWLCFPTNRYGVGLVLFARFFALLLALRGRGPRSGAATIGFGVALAFNLLSGLMARDDGALLLGHRARMVVRAEEHAREQLGPDYADYRFFSRGLDQVFRRGVNVTRRASLIAWSTDPRDVVDVNVEWTDPWD